MRSLPLVALGATLLFSFACSSRATRVPEAIAVPPTETVHAAIPALFERVEQGEGPPAWATHPRESGEWAYAVGSAPLRKTAEASLHHAVRAAQRGVAEQLNANGARVEAPRGLVAPLVVDSEEAELEALAYDVRDKRFYCLARIDRSQLAERAEERVNALDHSLDESLPLLSDQGGSRDLQVAAALSTLFALDRRAQQRRLYEVLSGESLEELNALSDASLEQQARSVLSLHSVRVHIDGPPIPGLYEAVSGALENLYLRPVEFGEDGWVGVSVEERGTWTPADPHLRLEGQLELSIEGAEARTRTLPLRAVARGSNADEARGRAEEALLQEVRTALQASLSDYDRL